MVDNGGENEIIQFWVNTPAKHKIKSPYYIPLSEKDTPYVKKNKATIQVVAGNFENIVGPAKTYSPQTLLRFETKSGADLSFSLPKSYNTLIYLLDGSIESDGKLIQSKEMAWYENDAENIEIKVLKSSRFIVLSGEPLKEPLVTYGPFVMNTREELNTAILDYQNGKMGTLNEIFD
jgi:hypothetical protein